MSEFSNAVWSFQTKHFLVTFEAEPEDLDPADGFDDAETVRQIRAGTYTWFCAAVRVFHRANRRHDWKLVATDYLGGCAYKSAMEFCTSHRGADLMDRNCTIMRAARGVNVSICHYFPSMVSEAIAEARKTLRLKAA